VKNVVEALNFVYRFYLIRQSVLDGSVQQILRFLEKSCNIVTNSKLPFGAREVRIMWDALEAKYGSVMAMPLPEIRTFMIAVFQHATFCRFSDLAQIKLSDLFFDLDFFKVKLRYSKTDQGGKGQWIYVPETGGPRSPHMLMCLFLCYVHPLQTDDVYLFPPVE